MLVTLVRSLRVEPCKWVHTNFFADYWCVRCLDWYEKACQTGIVQHFELSLKILNGRCRRRKIDMYKTGHFRVCGRNLGVNSWKLACMSLNIYIALLRFPRNLVLGFAWQKTAKIQGGSQQTFWKNIIWTNNQISRVICSDTLIHLSQHPKWPLLVMMGINPGRSLTTGIRSVSCRVYSLYCVNILTV